MKNRILIFSLFFLFAGLGTFLHECGHYAASYFYGLKPKMHYWCVDFGIDLKDPIVLNFTKFKSFFASFFGPFVNMAIGTIGFIVFFKKRRIITDKKVIALAVITFFWSRQVVIMLSHLILPLLFKGYGENSTSDEQAMSWCMSLPLITFPIILGIIGAVICWYAVFFLMPKHLRLQFIVFGILGSVCGAFVWFKLLGPFLLP